MEEKSRKLLHATAVILAAVMTLTYLYASVSVTKAGNTEYTDSLKAGAALILDSEIPVTEDAAQADVAEAGSNDSGRGGSAGQEPAKPEEEKKECTFVMTNVQTILNVRASASEDAPIIGRLYADCYGEIMERGDGWTLLRSGNVVGWAKNEYLFFDEQAQQMLAQVGRWTATANESGLRIRKEASTDADIYALLAAGDVVNIYEDLGEWLKVDYEGYVGYVSAEFVTVDLMYATGETLTEIAAREAAEAEAKRKAEEERAARRAALSEEQALVEANYSDLQLLAALIWCEAGNQPYEGQIAVGAVVMNRVNHPAYPNTISGVIYAPGQFTPAMTGKVARALERGVPDSCTQAAIEAMNGTNNVGDALHFNTLAIRTSDLIIGDHAFW